MDPRIYIYTIYAYIYIHKWIYYIIYISIYTQKKVTWYLKMDPWKRRFRTWKPSFSGHMLVFRGVWVLKQACKILLVSVRLRLRMQAAKWQDLYISPPGIFRPSLFNEGLGTYSVNEWKLWRRKSSTTQWLGGMFMAGQPIPPNIPPPPGNKAWWRA